MRECGWTYEQIENATLAEISCLLSSAEGGKQSPEDMQAAALEYQTLTPAQRLARARRG